jgi:hypothetical protein
MKRPVSILLAACLGLGPLAAPAHAQVRVERHGTENPMIEVFKSTIYGALAGLVVGGAIEWASEDSDGDAVKWGFITGTFVGLGFGLYWVNTRPQPRALFELEQGELRVNSAPTVEAVLGSSGTPDGARVHLVAVKL